MGTCLLLTKSINYLYLEIFELLPSPSLQAPEHSGGVGWGLLVPAEREGLS